MGCCATRERGTLGGNENCIQIEFSKRANCNSASDFQQKLRVPLCLNDANGNRPSEYGHNVDLIQSSTDVSFLLDKLNKGPDSTRLVIVEHLLRLGRSGQANFADDVVACKGLSTLARWFVCSHYALRMKCAALCALLYKRSPLRQDLFIQAHGHFKLVQLLSWSTNDNGGCKKVLKYLWHLILDQQERVRVYTCQKLFDAMLYEVLRQCQGSSLSATVLMRAQDLKEVLGEYILGTVRSRELP